MRRLSQVAGLVLLLVSIAATMAADSRIGVAGTGISLVAPAGYAPWSAAEIAQAAYPEGSVVLGNRQRTARLVIEVKPLPLSPGELDQVARTIQDGKEKIISGWRWTRRDTATLSGQRWARMEADYRYGGTDMHNLMWLTSYKGQGLTVEFDGTPEEFARVRADLQRSLDSIRLQ